MNENTQKKKWALKMPHPIVMLFMIALIMAVMTYIIPAGTYQRYEDPEIERVIVDPESYQSAERNPATPLSFLMAFPIGMQETADIIFFIFIVGGAFNIITATGAIEAVIAKSALATRGRKSSALVIPFVMLIFALGGMSFGMAEETIVFVPIGVALARAMGYDAMVGMSMVVLGAACGFCSAAINPFTVGVAQGIAELPLFSGLGLRIAVLVVMLTATALYILRYGSRVKRDLRNSYIYDVELHERENGYDLEDAPKLTLRTRLALLVVLAGFILIVYNVLNNGWYISELAATFLGMGIIGGFVGGLSLEQLTKAFLDGARDMTTTALLVGVARVMLVVMSEGVILDTIIHSLSSAIASLPKEITVLGMYVVQLVLNFFLPSGSGQAAATMPIMVPLSDVLEIKRQVAVLAFQFGDGFTNSIYPNGAILMANLGLAKISYNKWFKFMGPLMGIWIAIGAAFLIFATLTGYGPF